MTAPTTALRGRTRTRSAAGAPPKTLRRETHQPDYIILVAVIAMSAIGIPLHVYNALTIWFTRTYAVQWSLTAYTAFAWTAWIMLFLWSLVAIARSIRVIYAAS